MEFRHCTDLLIQFLALAGVINLIQAAAHAPCFSCELYSLMHGDQPSSAHKVRPGGDTDTQIRSKCTYPCECPSEHPKCKPGISIVKDGCGCCEMCGRQQGEYCDHKRMCDERKGFVCDFHKNNGLSGVCRAKSAEPCSVNGIMYKDGEEFKPECRRLCTCQNGHYGCVSLCPQEEKKPSTKNCINARLVPIPDQCCREWMCDNIQADNTGNFLGSVPTAEVVSVPTTNTPNCKRETSAWSACSTSCDMGLSVRVTNDNTECKPVQQIRFCTIRPCDMPEGKLPGKRCTPTLKPDEAKHLTYKECTSVKEYRPKYCSDCKKNKCCAPHITKTIPVKFECKHGVRETHDFMWIKNCKCHHRNCPFF
ncbi:CCN family member 2-like isoform X2 [Lineus longissimus]|uniref:CCN family member 2-like isoform X2 n=1 Tax=Lineus longissimus TaxID=88925 RepID=UPI00315DF18F